MQAVVQGVEHDAPICALAPSPFPNAYAPVKGGLNAENRAGVLIKHASPIFGDPPPVIRDVRRRLGRGAEVW